MRRPSAQPPIRSLPARAITLLSLGGYLLVAIGAPAWHLSGATCTSCAEQCAEGSACVSDSDQAHRHHCTKPHHAHRDPAQQPAERDDAPVHDEKDCSVCQTLAAKLLTPVAVSLIETSEPAVEALLSATPRPDRPSVAVVHSRGPPQHA